jgi:glyoxylase-like metal-dependent hydrolase (beta-lactamase superfamily II)
LYDDDRTRRAAITTSLLVNDFPTQLEFVAQIGEGMMSWRSMSAACLLFVSAAITPFSATSASPLLMSRQIAPDFRLEQVTRNVYAFISNNTTQYVEDGNTTVILTEKGVVVVDAPSTYLSERHLAEIRKLTKKSVIYLINTHWHPDHVLGNHVYRDAFPDMRIVAQDYTKEISDRVAPVALHRYQGSAGAALLEAARKVAQGGIRRDGTPLRGEDLEEVKRGYQDYVPVIKAAQGARFVGADMTFSDSLTLDLGDTTIKLLHFVGHTKGDAVVYLPNENILITGDLVIAPVPYGIDDITDSYIVSLEKLMAMRAKVIIPGHGEVQFDNAYMQLEHDLLQSLMKQAYRAASEYLTVDQFKKTVDLRDYEKKFVGNDPDRKWGWDNYFYDQAVTRAFDIARGAL